ncbi:MAG: hypothetical protein Kow00109_13570 [Acidobacteriota bacterium]
MTGKGNKADHNAGTGLAAVNSDRYRRPRWNLGGLAVALSLLVLLAVAPMAAAATESDSSRDGPRFLADDPLRKDPDDLPVPAPESRDLSQLYDFIANTFFLRPREGEAIPEAVNVNTLDEVPDSSWFTNRMSRRRLSLAELVRGPDVAGPPDDSAPWTIIAAKTQGITPGFRIRDARGRVYFMKFDPPGHPQLATSSEVVATAFFHAFGYHVPENYLVFVRPELFQISPEARLTDREGKERRFTAGDLRRIFARVHRLEDGTIPAVASLRLPGRPLGPFEYYGTRSDDANDIFPHQHRRELRGLRLFAAWLNHDDSRSINSLDMYLGEPGDGYVRHHLIDFGSCMGSGSVQVQSRRAGYEYIIEWGPILKAALSLGLWDRHWRKIPYPDIPSVGRFEAEHFDPEAWRPEYPNPAFERMRPRDAFWAAKIIARFSDEAVRALVAKGRWDDPRAEEYLAATLIARRDKILRRYLPAVAPVDEIAVDRAGNTATIRFADLAVRHGVLAPSAYRFEWLVFDNRSGTSEPLGVSGETTVPAPAGDIKVPLPRSSSEFLRVRLVRIATGHAADIYLRHGELGYTVVGVERFPAGRP